MSRIPTVTSPYGNSRCALLTRVYILCAALSDFGGWVVDWLVIPSPKRHVVFNQVVMKLSPDSVVVLGEKNRRWTQQAGEYAKNISRSR